jgi:hypothetical protein
LLFDKSLSSSVNDCRPLRGLDYFPNFTWGFAFGFTPRLYSIARFVGLRKELLKHALSYPALNTHAAGKSDSLGVAY